MVNRTSTDPKKNPKKIRFDWKEKVEPLPILNPERKKVMLAQFEVNVPQENEKTIKAAKSSGNIPNGVSYRFFGEFSFDKDAEDCMGTGTLRMPYEPTLWSFWEPGFQELWIVGGSYDLSTVFHGRTRGIKQDGEYIEIALQDDGWRLKQQYEGDVPQSGDSIGDWFTKLVTKAGMQPVISGLKEEYKVAGEDNTEGIITGSATGGTQGTFVTDSGSSSSDGSSGANGECDSTLASTGNGGVHPPAYMINGCGSAVGMPYDNDTKKHEWGPWKNICPECKAVGQMYWDGGGIACRACDVDHSAVHGYGTTSMSGGSELGNAPAGTGTPACKNPLIPCGNNPVGGGTGGTSGNTASEDEEKTYEDMLKDLCENKDLLFYTDFGNRCILYDYTSLMEEIESKCFKIENWMIKYPTFNLDVNQFGFYNTVQIKYKNGTIKESYEDLVSVYGEVLKKYDEPKMSKTEAQKTVKARLASLVRDFAMEIQMEVLHSGALLPGTFVSAENPLTKHRETYYVSGINVSQAPEGSMMCSLSLLYSPKNPEVDGIPEISGSTPVTGSGALDAIGAEEAKFNDVQQPVELMSEPSYMEKTGNGNCWADAGWLYNKLSAAGIKCQIVGFKGGGSGNGYRHSWVEINMGDGWKEYPYTKYNSKHFGYVCCGQKTVLVGAGDVPHVTKATFTSLGY